MQSRICFASIHVEIVKIAPFLHKTYEKLVHAFLKRALITSRVILLLFIIKKVNICAYYY